MAAWRAPPARARRFAAQGRAVVLQSATAGVGAADCHPPGPKSRRGASGSQLLELGAPPCEEPVSPPGCVCVRGVLLRA
eukprot:5983443-Lingulodinium_polyedra.AAC.1